MQEGAEACGKAEILRSVTFEYVKFNARRGRSLRQCRNLDKSDVRAGKMQCRKGQKPPAMQKSCQKRRSGGGNAMQEGGEVSGNAEIMLKGT